ncbi:hypothetical protein D3C77_607720 [compost metagenome]
MALWPASRPAGLRMLARPWPLYSDSLALRLKACRLSRLISTPNTPSNCPWCSSGKEMLVISTS